MVIVMSADAVLARDVRANLPSGNVLQTVSRAAEVDPTAIGRARACVYATVKLDQRAVAEIGEAQRRTLFLPLVLVMPESRENARALKDIVVSELVWQDAVADELAPAIQDAIATASVAERFAQTIESDPRFVDATIRRALVQLLRAGAPVPSKGDISKAAAYSPSRLSVKLADLFGGRTRPITVLKYVIRALHAYDLAHRGFKRDEVLLLELPVLHPRISETSARGPESEDLDAG